MAGIVGLNIYAGDDYEAVVTVVDDQGNPFDLTGYVAQSQIRTSLTDNSPTPAATFACTINSNQITMILDHTQTAGLTKSGYVWDIQVIDASGWITTLLAGGVSMTMEVTKIYDQQGGTTPLRPNLKRLQAINVQLKKAS
jgi:hypothetical protein